MTAALAAAPSSGRAQDASSASDTDTPRDAARSLPKARFDDERGPEWEAALAGELLFGHDTEPAAGVAPDQRAVATTPTGMPDPPGPPGPPGEEEGQAPDAAGFMQLGLRAAAEVGEAWWGRARLGWDYRQYLQRDRRSQGWLAVEGGWRSSDWAARLTIETGRYDDTLALLDAWNVRGDAALARWVGDRGMVGAHAEAGTLRYDGDLAPQSLAGGGLHGGFLHARVQAAAGVDVQRRWSDAQLVDRVELVPWVLAAYRHEWLTVEARYEAYVRRFDGDALDGAEHRLRLRSEVEPWDPPVSLVAGVEYGRARGDGQALRYDRFVVFGGVAVAMQWRADPPSAFHAPSRRQGPATVTDGGVRFRVDRPEAGTVAVIGTFNEWDPERGRLERRSDGSFEAVLPVPPGRHQYLLLVDGEARRPPGADAYAPDGLGGENAVLIVP
ncbi:MAG: isoamylase early set domain-containing protein [Myxococcota bacterium]